MTLAAALFQSLDMPDDQRLMVESAIERFVSEAVRLHSFPHPDGQRYINATDLAMMVSDLKMLPGTLMTNNTALSAFEQVALQKQVEELQQRIAMQDEALVSAKLTFDSITTTTHIDCSGPSEDIDKAISATSADVAAWQEKQLAPLRREVAMLRMHGNNLIEALGEQQHVNGSESFYQITHEDFAPLGEALDDAASSAIAYKKEVAAMALEAAIIRLHNDNSLLTNSDYEAELARMAAELRGETK